LELEKGKGKSRMKVSLQGYHSRYATFEAQGELAPGDLVQLCGSMTVQKATSGKFAGVARSVRDGFALIQTGGYAQVGYSGNKPAFGFVSLEAQPGGGSQTKVSDAGRQVLVVEVDESQAKAGILF